MVTPLVKKLRFLFFEQRSNTIFCVLLIFSIKIQSLVLFPNIWGCFFIKASPSRWYSDVGIKAYHRVISIIKTHFHCISSISWIHPPLSIILRLYFVNFLLQLHLWHHLEDQQGLVPYGLIHCSAKHPRASQFCRSLAQRLSELWNQLHTYAFFPWSLQMKSSFNRLQLTSF